MAWAWRRVEEAIYGKAFADRNPLTPEQLAATPPEPARRQASDIADMDLSELVRVRVSPFDVATRLVG